jgi:hypothetical protein
LLLLLLLPLLLLGRRRSCSLREQPAEAADSEVPAPPEDMVYCV